MLTYSIGASIDGFVADRSGRFDWGAPDDEQFDWHLAEVAGLGCHLLGRRLYETMRVWETDPALRGTPARTAFADAWTALPKVVFSRSLSVVEGNARLATGSLAEEVAAAVAATDRPVAVGGAELAGQAFEQGLVDELRVFRYPVVLGGGSPHLPPIPRPVPMELVETRAFADRVVYERFRRLLRTGEVSPGSP